MKKLVLSLCLAIFCLAWDGKDITEGGGYEPVMIKKGTLVRSGLDIKVYYTRTDETKKIYVEYIKQLSKHDPQVEIYGYDYKTGYPIILLMDSYKIRKFKENLK